MLAVRDLRKTFRPGTSDARVALDGVTLKVAAGALVVVVGTAGSGRATLLDAVAGRVALDAGSVHVDGVDVTRWDEARRAAVVGRVGRDPSASIAPGLTVAEHLALAAARGRRRGLRRCATRTTRAAWGERLRALGLELATKLDVPAGTLPAAERQALALVMATLGEPKLLLLDRPAAALVGQGADLVARLLEDLLAAPRPATMLVADSLQQAVALGDRLVVLDRGAVVADVSGAEKQRFRIVDLRARLDDLAERAQVDESVAALLAATYV